MVRIKKERVSEKSMKELCLREIQVESLKILTEIDSFCRHHNIRYFIMAGTLIGALRHKGFIPWDDDIDIVMFRKDYDRFLRLYEKKGRFRIINYQTEKKCPFMITRISNDQFELKTEFGPKYRIGSFVDVYPFDGVGNSRDQYLRVCRESSKHSKRLARSLERNPIYNTRKLHRGLKKWLLLPTYIIPKIKGPEYYRNKLLKLKDVYPLEESQYVGTPIWCQIEKAVYKKEWFEELIEVPFENITVFAPKYYDEILKQQYGDYMKMPPEEERIGHHFYKIFTIDNYCTRKI